MNNPIQMLIGTPPRRREEEVRVEPLPDYQSLLKSRVQQYAQENNKETLAPEEFESIYSQFEEDFKTYKAPRGRDNTQYRKWVEGVLAGDGTNPALRQRALTAFQQAGIVAGTPVTQQAAAPAESSGLTGMALSAPLGFASGVARLAGGTLELAGAPLSYMGAPGNWLSGAGEFLSESGERTAEINREMTMTPQELEAYRQRQIARKVAYEQAGGGAAGVAAQAFETVRGATGRDVFEGVVESAPAMIGGITSMARGGLKGLAAFSGVAEGGGAVAEARQEVDRIFADPAAREAFLSTPDGKALYEQSLQAVGGDEKAAVELAKTTAASNAKMFAGAYGAAAGALLAAGTGKLGLAAEGIGADLVKRMAGRGATQAAAGAAAPVAAQAARAGGLGAGLAGAAGAAVREAPGEVIEEMGVDIAGGFGQRAGGLPTDPFATAGQSGAMGAMTGAATGGGIGFAEGYIGDPNAPAPTAPPAAGAGGIGAEPAPAPAPATPPTADAKAAFDSAGIDFNQYIDPNTGLYAEDLKTVFNDETTKSVIDSFAADRANAGVISSQINRIRNAFLQDPNAEFGRFDFGDPDSTEFTSFYNKLARQAPLMASGEASAATKRLVSFLQNRKEQYDKFLAPTEQELSAMPASRLANYLALNNDGVLQAIINNAEPQVASQIRTQVANRKADQYGEGQNNDFDLFSVISQMNDNSAGEILAAIDKQEAKQFEKTDVDAVRGKARATAQMSAAQKLSSQIRASRPAPVDLANATDAQLVSSAFNTKFGSFLKKLMSKPTAEGDEVMRAFRDLSYYQDTDIDLRAVTRGIPGFTQALREAIAQETVAAKSATSRDAADAQRRRDLLVALGDRAGLVDRGSTMATQDKGQLLRAEIGGTYQSVLANALADPERQQIAQEANQSGEYDSFVALIDGVTPDLKAVNKALAKRVVKTPGTLAEQMLSEIQAQVSGLYATALERDAQQAEQDAAQKKADADRAAAEAKAAKEAERLAKDVEKAQAKANAEEKARNEKIAKELAAKAKKAEEDAKREAAKQRAQAEKDAAAAQKKAASDQAAAQKQAAADQKRSEAEKAAAEKAAAEAAARQAALSNPVRLMQSIPGIKSAMDQFVKKSPSAASALIAIRTGNFEAIKQMMVNDVRSLKSLILAVGNATETEKDAEKVAQLDSILGQLEVVEKQAIENQAQKKSEESGVTPPDKTPPSVGKGKKKAAAPAPAPAPAAATPAPAPSAPTQNAAPAPPAAAAPAPAPAGPVQAQPATAPAQPPAQAVVAAGPSQAVRLIHDKVHANNISGVSTSSLESAFINLDGDKSSAKMRAATASAYKKEMSEEDYRSFLAGYIRDETTPSDPQASQSGESKMEAIEIARKLNTFRGDDDGAGIRVGYTQKKGTPVDRLFSNFADTEKDAKNLSWFRREMLERATKEIEGNKSVGVYDFYGGMRVRVESSTMHMARDVKLYVLDGNRLVGGAYLKRGMIDSIAVDESAKGMNIGLNLMLWMHDNRIANIFEVPDRSPGFVSIQKAAISTINQRANNEAPFVAGNSREKSGISDNILWDGGIQETQVTNARDGAEVASVIERATGKPVPVGAVQIVDPVLTREERRVLEAITGGKPVVFYTVADGAPGSSARGFFDPMNPGRVYVRAARGMMTFVAGHEFAHMMQLSNPTLFAELQARLQQMARDGVLIDDEAVADTWGAMVAGSRTTLNLLGQNSPPSFFARILEAISKFWNEKIRGIKNEILNRKDIEDSVLNGLYSDAEAVKAIVHQYMVTMAGKGLIQEIPAGTTDPQLSQQRDKAKKIDPITPEVYETLANEPKINKSAPSNRQKILNRHRPLDQWKDAVERFFGGVLADRIDVPARIIAAAGIGRVINSEDKANFVDPLIEEMNRLFMKYKDVALRSVADGGAGVSTRAGFNEVISIIMYAKYHAAERNYMHMLLHSKLRAPAERLRERIILQVKKGQMSPSEGRARLDELVRDPTNVIELVKEGSGMDDATIASWKRLASRLGMDADLDNLDATFMEPIRKRQDEHLQQSRSISAADTNFKKLLGFKHYFPSKGFFREEDNYIMPRAVATNIYDTSFVRMEGRASLGKDFIGNLINDMFDFGKINANTKVREAIVNALKFEQENPNVLGLGLPLLKKKNGQVQFSGSSVALSGYLTVEELDPGMAALLESGQLKDNAFVYRDDAGKVWYVKARDKESAIVDSLFEKKREIKERDGFSVVFNNLRTRVSRGDGYLSPMASFARDFTRELARGGFMQVWGDATRLFGSLMTGRNPFFWAPAAAMDYTYFTYTMATYYGGYAAIRTLGNAAEYLPEALRFEVNATSWDDILKQGKAAIAKNEDSYLRWMTEFTLNGGRFTMMDSMKFTAEGIKSSLARDGLINAMKDRLGIKTDENKKSILDRFDGVSSAADLSNRVAAYRTQRLMGVSAQRATAITKAFMNYEEMGSSQFLKWLAPMYTFLRPIVAGTSAASRQLYDAWMGTKDGGHQGLWWIGSIAAIGYMMLMGMSDEELEELAIENATRNLQLPGDYQIPVAYGVLQAAYSAGVLLAAWQREKISSDEAAFLLARSGAQNLAPIPASPADPGDNPTWWAMQTAIPTLPRVFGTNLATNRDDFGRPIWLEENPNRYDFENSKENTPQQFRDMAKLMFETTGFDVPPESLQYLLKQMGGFGSGLNRLWQMEIMRQKGIDVGEGSAAAFSHVALGRFVNRDALNSGFRTWMSVKDNLAEYQRALSSPTVGEKTGPVDPRVRQLGLLSKKLDSEYTQLRNRVRKATTQEQKVAAQRAIEAWYRDATRRYNLIAPPGKRIFVANDQPRQ